MFCMSKIALQFAVNYRAGSTYGFEKLLSMENRERTLAKLNRMKQIRLQTQEPAKKAAILVPICIVNNNVSLLYIVRPSPLTEYKEKVNLPGDMQDGKDNNMTETARRVAESFLGLQYKDMLIWGMGNVIVARSDYTFVPVICEILGGFTNDRLILDDSIEEVFTIPIKDLCNSKTNAYTQFKDDYSSPVFMGGKWRIWGFTAMITNIFLKAFLPPRGYTHRVKHLTSIKKGTKFPRTVK